MIVSPGSIVTLSIAGQTNQWTSLFTSAAAGTGAIIDAINDSGWLTVVSQQWNPTTFFGAIGALDLVTAPFTATLKVKVSTASSAVDSSDVENLVAQAVRDVTGYAATVSSETSAGGSPDTANPLQWVIDFVNQIKALGAFAIVAVVILIGMLIFYVGPNTKISA